MTKMMRIFAGTVAMAKIAQPFRGTIWLERSGTISRKPLQHSNFDAVPGGTLNPLRQYLKLSLRERSVPPHLLGVRSGTIGAELDPSKPQEGSKSSKKVTSADHGVMHQHNPGNTGQASKTAMITMVKAVTTGLEDVFRARETGSGSLPRATMLPCHRRPRHRPAAAAGAQGDYRLTGGPPAMFPCKSVIWQRMHHAMKPSGSAPVAGTPAIAVLAGSARTKAGVALDFGRSPRTRPEGKTSDRNPELALADRCLPFFAFQNHRCPNFCFPPEIFRPLQPLRT
jgi:hypothetical protein